MDKNPSDPSAADPNERGGLVTASDFAVMLGLPVLAAIAWLLPERSWLGITRRFVPFYAPMLPKDAKARIAQRLKGHRFAENPAHAPDAILREVVSADIFSLIGVLRDYRPGGWRPAIEVSGRGHVARALEQGRGAILWVGYFAHADLIAKMALHQAGFSVAHLSHPFHRYSKTRFGVRYLNPVQTRIEDRYLGARVMLSPGGSAGALAILHQALAENGVVSITARGTSRRPLTTPFLSGQIDVAPGALSLAHKTGAALLPVFPIRDETGVFRVCVEPPIEFDRSVSRTEASAAAIRRYAGLLEGYVLTYPGQWLGWSRA